MTLYTGRGDEGETDVSGQRVRKDHYRVEAVGAVDELNAALGVVISLPLEGEGASLLTEIQNDLFTVGAELGLPPGVQRPKKSVSLPPEAMAKLERGIERIQADVGPQRAFVLPRGSREAALLHYARTVARRVERRVVALASRETVNPVILSYLNRLSSLLHAMALKANKDAGVVERNPTYP